VGSLRAVEVALGDQLAVEERGLAIEVALGVDHADPGLGGVGLGLGQRRPGVLDVRSRLLDLRLLVEDHGLGGRDVGARLVDLGVEDLGIDARDDLVLLHERVEVGQ
jgi:hypothetical protein